MSFLEVNNIEKSYGKTNVKGEVPGVETVIGGILIVGGMILFQLEKQKS